MENSLRSMDLEGHWLVTLALVSSSLIATTANFLLVLVFLRRRGLRTASNRFVINLLFINLVSSLLLVPFLIVDKEAATGARRRLLEEFNVSEAEIVESADKEFILEKVSRYANGTLYESLLIENRSADADDLEIIQANFSVDLLSGGGDAAAALDGLCAVSQFSLNFICTASILSILLIGIDQYVAVLHPLRSHSYINKSKSLVLIIISWLISGSFASVTAALGTNGSFFTNICASTAQTTANRIFAVAYFLLVILLPFLTICLIYVLIYNAAHKNSSRIRKSTNNTQQEPSTPSVTTTTASATASGGGVCGFPKVHSAPNLNKVNEMRELKATKSVTMTRTHSERPPRRLISSLKTRISNASVFRYREENRTAKISILVIFMVLVCYVPYGILYIANTASTQLRVFNQISLVLLISSNLLSPILFAYRNRRVQRELKKYLKGFTRDSMGTNHGGSGGGNAKPQIVVNHITNRSEVDVEDDDDEDGVDVIQPFLQSSSAADAASSHHQQQTSSLSAPRCTVELEKKSILKRVCSKNWSSYKKCSFIAVPDSCLDARGSFSSASTQISTED